MEVNMKKVILFLAFLALGFTGLYSQSPVITGIEPFYDDCQLLFTVNGQHFGASPGTKQIKMKSGSYIYTPDITGWTSNQINCRLFGNFKLGREYKVVVWDPTTSSSLSNAFKWIVNTEIKVTSKDYPVGTSAGISGCLLGNTQDSRKVMIGNAEATVTLWSCEDIVITIPSLPPGTYKLRLKDGATRISNRVNIKIVAATPPNITGISPLYDDCQLLFDVNGNHFGSIQGTKEIKMKSGSHVYTPQVTQWTSNKIDCKLTGNFKLGKTYKVVVWDTSTSSALSNKFPWEVLTKINVSKKNYQSGEVVGISGCLLGFSQGTREVMIGTTPASVSSWSCEDIVITIPSLPPGNYKLYLKDGAMLISNKIRITII
jgi:hypothetical protein